MLTNKIYSDLDLNFLRVPGKGDVALSYNEQAVVRSIKNLLYTNKYDRLFQPGIYSNNMHYIACCMIVYPTEWT